MPLEIDCRYRFVLSFCVILGLCRDDRISLILLATLAFLCFKVSLRTLKESHQQISNLDTYERFRPKRDPREENRCKLNPALGTVRSKETEELSLAHELSSPSLGMCSCAGIKSFGSNNNHQCVQVLVAGLNETVHLRHPCLHLFLSLSLAG